MSDNNTDSRDSEAIEQALLICAIHRLTPTQRENLRAFIAMINDELARTGSIEETRRMVAATNYDLNVNPLEIVRS